MGPPRPDQYVGGSGFHRPPMIFLGSLNMRVIEQLREKLGDVVSSRDILNQRVDITLTPLSAEEAIGTPERQDFPIQKGKEKVIEARFNGFAGQAFSDELVPHSCTVAQLLEWDLSSKANQAAFTAAGNAIARSLALCEGTVHCRDKEPKRCAQRLPEFLTQNYPQAKTIALVGLQPAMAQALADAGYQLTIFDHDPDNIGQERFGTTILDGAEEAKYLPGFDLVLATGSTLANGSIDQVLHDAAGAEILFFGITIAGAAALLGLKRYCPFGA